MSILVTGAAGFIGSHVAQSLLETGHEVIGLDDLSGGFEDNLPDGMHFIKGSILDVDLIRSIFEEYRFRHVYHLAAYAAEGLSHFIRRFNYSNNVLGSINLINESVRHDVDLFVFTSSIAVYGANQVPMCEDMIPLPEDPYGVAKYTVELDLKAAHEMFGLNYVIFRPHNVFGERQHIGDRYRNVVGIFMNQIMRGEKLSIFGDGSQTRAFSYISDVASTMASCITIPEAYNSVFNIGADQQVSVLRIAEIISRVFKGEVDINFLPERKEVLHAYADHSKIRKILKFTDSTTLEEGIERMAAWAKKKGPMEPTRFEGIELERNLPASWK